MDTFHMNLSGEYQDLAIVDMKGEYLEEKISGWCAM